ncbi:MAG: RNB domain-containing ribonuclease, partial [Proteobacteria bacterium]
SKSVMGGNLAKKLTKALESMEGKPEAQILNILTLRTMQQAHYSENNVGHFGLGFTHYSHFTSPIRRYPDLIAHRIIKSQLYDKYQNMEMSAEDLQSATTWLSATEQRSTKAERKVISIKKARFIRRYVDQEFEGMISSVAKFGCFVLLRQFDVDGLVKIENLGNDRFEFDEENLRLVGRKGGLVYSIGDQVKVVVTGADPETGKVDFQLSEIISQRGAEGADVDSFFDEERGSRRGGKPGPRKKSRTSRRADERTEAKHGAAAPSKPGGKLAPARGAKGKSADKDKGKPKRGKKTSGKRSGR